VVTKAKSQTQLERTADVYAPACPSRAVLDHVTSRWAVLVLIALTRGRHRFSELRRAVTGVSEKMLAQTLKDLEHDGFVARKAFAEVPPRVEYTLTPLGRGAATKVASLVDWIEESLPRVLAARAAHDAGTEKN
jgi:DNA-binding HxlR family transcriptional regulator